MEGLGFRVWGLGPRGREVNSFGSRFQVLDVRFWFRVRGSRLWVLNFEFEASGCEFLCLEFRICGFRFRISGRIQGQGFRV